MQGHRSSLTTLPENLTFDHGSMSSDTGIDSQISWNSMQNSAPNRLPEYRLSSSGTNQYPRHLVRHNGQQNAPWSLGETSSSAAQNHLYGNEGKVEHHIQHFQSRTALTLEEPSNIISLENNVINLNGNQTTTNGSFVMQTSSSDAISQDLNMISGFVEDEDADCQIVEHPNTYTSVGSSGEVRPRCSCKRKALEAQVGPSSGAGTSNSFQITERVQWNALPADQIAPSYINLPTQMQNAFVFNNGPDQANPRLRLGVGGAVPTSPFSLTSSGNAESSRRNLHIHSYNNLPPQDTVAANPFLGETDIGNRDVSTSRHSTRFALRNQLLDLNPVPPMENSIPPPVRRNPQTRWSRASSSRTSRSPAAPNPIPYQEPAEANVPRSISEHPIFAPAATEMGSSSDHPTSWNLAGGNNSTVGNVISASESGPSSGFNLSAAAWPNRSRPQFPRRLSEMVRRSMLSSAGIDSGGQSTNHAVRASPSLTPREMALLSGAHSHDRHAPSARSAMLERNLNGAYGGPYSLRTLAAGSEGRSSIMSEQIRHVLNLMRRGEGLRIEDMMLLDHSVFYGMADLHDRHREMRLDVDSMSYEELLALEERIGNVCTGLSEEAIMNGLKQHKYIDNDGSRNQVETEPCSICREEYNDGDDLGRLDCGHDYHRDCIKQWLVQKNSCPICKKTGLST